MIYKLEREDLMRESVYTINLYEGNDAEVISSEAFNDKEDATIRLNNLASEGYKVMNLVDEVREYTIVIEETIEKTIIVKSNSIENALGNVSERYFNGEIILEAVDYSQTNIYQL